MAGQVSITQAIPVPLHQVYSEQRFFLDYLRGAADRFFTHPYAGLIDGRADGLGTALDRRQAAVTKPGLTPSPPAAEVGATLVAYNRELHAAEPALAAAHALGDTGTVCVITGQQAGFLGGPAYTLYKIITAITLAERIEQHFGVRCVPVFWLASEDHDFAEINHAHYLGADGVVGRVEFGWDQAGRSISDLPVTAEIEHAAAEFFARQSPGAFHAAAQRLLTPRGAGFARALARALSELFGGDGLVIVEPHVMRDLCPQFFAAALRAGAEIGDVLGRAASALEDGGYPAPLDPERAGRLFSYVDGQRLRVDGARAAAATDSAAAPPGDHAPQYSTDAALRPVFADHVLPTVASVLGAGEIAYHGMLKGIYDLFGVPQPVLVPRRGFTVLPAAAAAVLDRFSLDPGQLADPQFSVQQAFAAAVPAPERAPFGALRERLAADFAPLRAPLQAIDPNLARTWQRALAHAQRAVDRLEERATRATMSQRGAGRRQLQQLRDLAWPRNRPQERVLPAAYLISQYGPTFPAALRAACDPLAANHEVLLVAAAPDPHGSAGTTESAATCAATAESPCE